jgi:predicted transcriptional regulator
MNVTRKTYDRPPSKSTMAISNELSSEIAAAILANQKNPQELHRLKEILLRVHSTLQKMSLDARAESASEIKPPVKAASQTQK